MLSDSQAASLRQAAADKRVVGIRYELAGFAAKTFAQVGGDLVAVGTIFGGDRVAGRSPFGHGSDEIVAVSMLLRIGGQRISASADLFKDGRHYAAAALLRQMVEIEYFAWAFQTRDKDAEQSVAERRRRASQVLHTGEATSRGTRKVQRAGLRLSLRAGWTPSSWCTGPVTGRRLRCAAIAL